MAINSVEDDDVERWLLGSAVYEMDAPVARLRASLRSRSGEVRDPRLEEELRLADRLGAMVRGLAQLARDEAPRLESINVHDAIELALQVTWQEVATRACVTRRYRAIPHARGHQTVFARALVALLRNAAQSIPAVMPGANRISIETECAGEGWILVDVVDTGVGIAPEDLPHVFEPFFTSKGPLASGLGLSAARAAIEGLGGTLTAESHEGSGSRFRISLLEDVTCSASTCPTATIQTMPLRRVLVAANALEGARALASMIYPEDTSATLVPCEEALERLALGERFEWIVWEGRSWANGGYRERLAQLSPDALSRTIPLSIPRLPGCACEAAELSQDRAPANEHRLAILP
jgi:hypothetical protein